MEEIIPAGKMALGKSWSKGREKEGPWGDLGEGKDKNYFSAAVAKRLRTRQHPSHPVQASSVTLRGGSSHVPLISGSLQTHSAQGTGSGQQVLPDKSYPSQASLNMGDLIFTLDPKWAAAGIMDHLPCVPHGEGEGESSSQ